MHKGLNCLGLSVAKDFSTLAGVFANADCKDVNWLRDKLFSPVKGVK